MFLKYDFYNTAQMSRMNCVGSPAFHQGCYCYQYGAIAICFTTLLPAKAFVPRGFFCRFSIFYFLSKTFSLGFELDSNVCKNTLFIQVFLKYLYN